MAPLTNTDKEYLDARFGEVKEHQRAVMAEQQLKSVEQLSEALAAHKANCGARQAYRRVKIWMVLALFTGGGLIVALIKWLPTLWQKGV